MKMNIGMATSTKLVFCSHATLPTMSMARSQPEHLGEADDAGKPKPTPTQTPAMSRRG